MMPRFLYFLAIIGLLNILTLFSVHFFLTRHSRAQNAQKAVENKILHNGDEESFQIQLNEFLHFINQGTTSQEHSPMADEHRPVGHIGENQIELDRWINAHRFNLFPFFCSHSDVDHADNAKNNSVIQLVIAIHVSSYLALQSVLKTWANCTELQMIVPYNTNTTFITFSTHAYSSNLIVLKYPNATFFEATKNLFKYLYSTYPNSHWYMVIKDNTLLYVDNLYKTLRETPNFTDPSNENYYCGYPLKHPNTSVVFASGDAGFLVSRGTLRTLVENDFEDKCLLQNANTSQVFQRYDEMSLGMCLNLWNISLTDIVGFHPDTPEKMIYFSNKATPAEFVRKEPRVVHENRPITYYSISPERMEIMFNRKRKIPKVLHQIWIGPLSSAPLDALQSCQDLHSEEDGWKYILWTEENVRNLPFFVNEELFFHKNIQHQPAKRSDYLRYEVCLHSKLLLILTS